MRKIVYYVAISLDGFIEGVGGDISGFVAQGSGVDQYLRDLQDYDTVIMGRKTYEFGYQYGLEPGKLAYAHMSHYIFSETLQLEVKDDRLHVCPMDIDVVRKLKEETGTDVYLCGGGQFASWVLKHQLIDQIKIKLNPVVLGQGTRIFEGLEGQYHLCLLDQKQYDDGLVIMTYDVQYAPKPESP